MIEKPKVRCLVQGNNQGQHPPYIATVYIAGAENLHGDHDARQLIDWADTLETMRQRLTSRGFVRAERFPPMDTVIEVWEL